MPTPPKNLSAADSFNRLQDGNRRYAQGMRSVDAMVGHSGRDLKIQSPFAIVLGCSDSRAPAEMVFDQGLGDLFVIRVAGPIVAPSQVGSVEFAIERFGTRLVVVMGHTLCGAIDAAIEAITSPKPTSTGMSSIVNRLRPAIEGLVQTSLGKDPEQLRRAAMRANVRASVNHLSHGSELIERLALDEGLLVVGAELDLATGVVAFLDDLPKSVGQSEAG